MFVNFPIEDVYIINSHACISLVQKLVHVMAYGTDFHFLSDGDGNRKRGGINDYPAALELENRVKEYVMGAMEKLKKQQLDEKSRCWIHLLYIGINKKKKACGSLQQQSI